MSLVKDQLKIYLQQKSIIGFLSFSLLPIVVLIASLLPTELLQVGGMVGAISAFDFYDINITIIAEMVIPSIVLAYGVSHLLRNEIEDSILYLYKDINRNKIINSKVISIICLITLMFIIVFVLSLGTYYFYFINESYSSGTFIPHDDSLWDAVITLLSSFSTMLISILLALLLSIRFGSGLAIVGATFFASFSAVSPLLTGIKWFFPDGYKALIDQLGGALALGIMVVVSLVYCIILWLLIKYSFKIVEF